MDWDRVRSDFPLLRRTFHGKPLVYLDSAATSQKPQVVIDAVCEFYSERNANVHRGAYQLSEEATEAYEGARARMARFLRAADPSEVVFVRGTTEAINLLATSLQRGYLKPGDRVVTTVMEHHSNIVPWHMLRTYAGIDLAFLDIDETGRLDLTELDRLLKPPTKLLTLGHVSNVLGTVNPVRAIADQAHAAGVLVLVDAAQSVPHRAVDVGALGADFLAFSGHKMVGPTGIGVLWARRELLDKMPPAMGGGEMIREVKLDRVAYRDPPGKFEAGTPNIEGAVGLSVAADYLEGLGWEEIAQHDRELQRRAFRRAEETLGDRIRIYGPREIEDREAVVSFALRGIHAHDVSSILDAEGIAIRSGHHCAHPLMDRLKVPALSRASPYIYNTLGEIDRLYEALEKCVRVFDGPTASLPSSPPAAVAGVPTRGS
ncbi:MAG: SufS family cysteine desulfurase [Thermoplasmata archaeon]|nr:SufS family cysteine desulfurase [Thermoplasmata archaeon]